MDKPQPKHQTINDAEGNPAFIVIPYAAYQIVNDAEGKPAYVIIPCADMQPPPPPAAPEEPPIIDITKYRDVAETNSWIVEKDNGPPEKLPKTLLGWRDYFSLTQTEMALRMGVKTTKYRSYEAAIYPQRKTLVKAVEVLGISVDKFQYQNPYAIPGRFDSRLKRKKKQLKSSKL